MLPPDQRHLLISDNLWELTLQPPTLNVCCVFMIWTSPQIVPFCGIKDEWKFRNIENSLIFKPQIKLNSSILRQ